MGTAFQSVCVACHPACCGGCDDGPDDRHWPPAVAQQRADRAGSSALHVAALGGHREVCVALLDGGAPIDALEGGKRTPLSLASEAGNGVIVAALLRARADPEMMVFSTIEEE